MTQMPLAAIAMHFGATREKAAIIAFADHILVHRLKKRRPTGAALEFMRMIEQRRVTTFAAICARFLWEIIVGMRTFRAVFAQDLVFKFIKRLAPILVRSDNFFHGFPLRRSRVADCAAVGRRTYRG